MRKRKICVVTSTRAEYGLLFWLLHELKADPSIALQLLVTGTHLSERHGMTVNQIDRDHLTVTERIPMQLDDDTPLGITRSLAQVTVGISAAIERIQPDLMILLGDRFEILGAAQAALIARVPIAHIHGGESTEGAIDEAIRHSVTKIAHLHFVAADAFRRRVLQLGESPERVWTVGAMGLDNIDRLKLLNREALEKILGIKLGKPSFLFTYHPPTLDKTDHGSRVTSFLNSMSEIGASIVVTGVNADTGSTGIRKAITKFVATCPERATLVESLGSLHYLSTIAQVDAVVGNSSSGLIEAPSLGIPTIDIGNRQLGRLRAPSVIHCDDNPIAFNEAIAKVLSRKHREIAFQRKTPYGEPGAARKILEIVRSYPLTGLLYKKFYSPSIN